MPNNIYGDPAECKCECHDAPVYDPKSNRETYTFVSHSKPCCGPERKGSRVESLPTSTLTEKQAQDLDYFVRNLWRALKVPGDPEQKLNEADQELKTS